MMTEHEWELARKVVEIITTHEVRPDRVNIGPSTGNPCGEPYSISPFYAVFDLVVWQQVMDKIEAWEQSISEADFNLVEDQFCICPVDGAQKAEE